MGPDEPNVAAVTADTPRILSNAEYRGFWVTWFGGSLRVGSAGVVEPFLTLPLAPIHSLALQYFSFPIDSESSDEPVRWRFVCKFFNEAHKMDNQKMAWLVKKSVKLTYNFAFSVTIKIGPQENKISERRQGRMGSS